jgi:hypothetical protein
LTDDGEGSGDELAIGEGFKITDCTITGDGTTTGVGLATGDGITTGEALATGDGTTITDGLGEATGTTEGTGVGEGTPGLITGIGSVSGPGGVVVWVTDTE